MRSIREAVEARRPVIVDLDRAGAVIRDVHAIHGGRILYDIVGDIADPIRL